MYVISVLLKGKLQNRSSPKGRYKCVFSSDDKKYGGTGTTLPVLKSIKEDMHDFENCVEMTIPALSTVYYKRL